MPLYDLLLDELDQIPPDARPTGWLMHPAVLLVLKKELYDNCRENGYPVPKMLNHNEPVMLFCDLRVTLTTDIAFAQLKYERLPFAQFYGPDDAIPWQDWS